MAGAKVDAAGNVVEEQKPQPDPIDKSLASRLKGGSLTNVVVDKTKKDTTTAFKLKIKGGQPKISAIRKDPAEAQAAAVAEKEAEVQKMMKTACEIDLSLQDRLKAGSLTS